MVIRLPLLIAGCLEGGPLARYNALVHAGVLRPDSFQESVAATHLQPVYERILQYQPSAPGYEHQERWWSKVISVIS
jgi:hypothetical protein